MPSLRAVVPLQDNNPQATVTNLIAVLRRSPRPDSRTFCAVLLRKVRHLLRHAGAPHNVARTASVRFV